MAERIHDTVTHARNLCDNVQWSPMDATRTEEDYLCRTVEIAIKAGATTINVPDTVGYTAPRESADLIRMLINRVPGADSVIFATHCHNDLGLATANSLAAVRNGARQVECTINGIGERAGNCSLEEVVMAIHTRAGRLPVTTAVHTEHIHASSRLVSMITGVARYWALFLMMAQVWYPSSRGIMISTKIRSGLCRATMERASKPFSAVTTS